MVQLHARKACECESGSDTSQGQWRPELGRMLPQNRRKNAAMGSRVVL